MTALTASMRTIGFVFPPLAAEISYRMFGYLGRPETVHPRDRAVHDRATVGTITAAGKTVMTYRWGSGPRLIVLTHGWRSRASRFSAIVEALESPDATLVAFDAPGNGASPGRETTVFDYAAAIGAIAKSHGPVDTLVGHSFGVLASFIAAREGVAVRRVVGVSGMYNAEQLVSQFSKALGLSPRAARGLRKRIERRTFPTMADPWRRGVAELDPASYRVPVLLVHDTDDRIVDPGQALLIADAHTGPVQTMITSGLGHNRILSNPEVIERIVSFVLPVELETAPSDYDQHARDQGDRNNQR